MDHDNPYAPPRSHVTDVSEPGATLTYADRGTRFAAALLDGIIFGAMVYAPILAAAVIGGGLAGATGGDVDGDAIVGIVFMAGIVGFFIWSGLTIRFVLRNSQSIGKKILGIKVVRSDGSPAGFARIFWLRNAVNWVLSIVPFYVFVDPLFIFSESHQCLHDKLADTIVVKV